MTEGRKLTVLVAVVAAMTVGLTVFMIRAKQWGPHSRSVDLLQADGRPDVAADVTIGKPAPPIRLTDVNGVRHDLTHERGHVVVLVVQGNHCPCSAAYVDRLNALQKDYAAKGVELWAFNPNVNETEAETKAYVTRHQIKYATSYDPKSQAADQIGASCTTESWIVDTNGKMQYHGRIDDNIYHPEKVTEHDLTNALNYVLAGKTNPHPETQAYACTINREGGV